MAQKKLNVNSSKSKVSFQIKKLGLLTVKGTIVDFQGDVEFDENKLENSSFNLSIGSKTIDTGNAKRDEHLRNEDFFNVEEFPKISFESSSINKVNNQFVVIGKLFMLKETKEISIPFTYQNGVLNGGFSLNRKEYGLGMKFPAFFVGKNVNINIQVKIN